MAGGLDFGILQPIAPTNRVVAQVPQQASGINQLAQGVMQGAEVGSNLASQAVARQKTQQDITQNAQMFPSQLEQAKNAAASSDMDLAAKKQGAEDMAAKRAAAIQGPDQFEKVLGQQSPEALQTYLLAKSKVQESVATVAKTNAGTDTTITKNYSDSMSNIAQVARAAAAGSTPQLQQQIWDLGVSQLPAGMQKAAATAMAASGNGQPGYNQVGGMAISSLGHEADSAQHIKAIEDGKGSEIEKNAVGIAMVQHRIQNTPPGQQPDPTDVSTLQQLQQANAGLAAKNSTPKASNIDPNGPEAQVNKADGDILKKTEEAAQPIKNFISDSSTAQKLLNDPRFPAGKVGPIAELTKYGYTASEVQELKSVLSNMSLVAKSALEGQTAGLRMTGTEYNGLKDAAGNAATTNLDALKNIVNRNLGKAQAVQHNQWETSDRIRSSADSTQYEKWKTQNPEPYNPQKASESTGLVHNGQDVTQEALQKARLANPGLKDEDIAAKYGLQKKGSK
jgi:hypothetical protein